MIVELSIVPLGNGSHISKEVAEALKIIDQSGLPYELTAAGTCIEGEWEEVMRIVRRCHDRVRQLSPHVITTIKIEDEEGAVNQLSRYVESVQEKLGHQPKRAKSTHLVDTHGKDLPRVSV